MSTIHLQRELTALLISINDWRIRAAGPDISYFLNVTIHSGAQSHFSAVLHFKHEREDESVSKADKGKITKTRVAIYALWHLRHDLCLH